MSEDEGPAVPGTPPATGHPGRPTPGAPFGGPPPSGPRRRLRHPPSACSCHLQ